MKTLVNRLVMWMIFGPTMFFAQPDPDTPQSGVGPYPVGSAVAGTDGAIAIPQVPAVYTIATAISQKRGTVLLNGSGALAMTLAAPVAGPASQGGDDGSRLRIIDISGHAHTVTNTSPGFNAAGSGGDVSTGAGAKGNTMEVEAYNGVWYATNLKGFTLG